MAKETSKTPWQKIRKLFQDIHLWLGLSSGLIIVAVCLSGTIYVFSTELTEKAAPHLYKVNPIVSKVRIPAENFLHKIADESGGRITSINVFADPSKTYQFYTRTENDKSRSGTTYFVNPYTGEIAGNSTEKNSMKEFMGYMFSLHRWLLLDKIEKPLFQGISNRDLGSKITGWATILFTLGCITGIVIWFPKRIKNWRQGLKIKTNANWKRVNHDVHNSLAFYSLIFLLMMGLTGPQWSFDWYRTGIQKSLGTYKEKKENGEKKESVPKKEGLPEMENINQSEQNKTINLSAFIGIADNKLPYEGDYRITLPETGDTILSFSKTKTGFFAPAAGDKLSINSLNGEILKVDIFTNKPFNERIAGSIKAIHVGTVYGAFTKWLYFLACLIATSLPITGTLIWINKLKKRKKKKTAQTSVNKKILSEKMVLN